MVSFKKAATLLLFAYICECDAQKEQHASTLSTTNAADDERGNRSLLLNLPDCSNPENYEKAQCICRNPSNVGMDLCKKWFEKVSVRVNSNNTTFSGTDTGIIGGSDVSNGEYPWFAKSTKGTKWDGCGGALVSPQFVLTAAHCVGTFNGFEIGAICHSGTYMPNGNCGQSSQVISSSKIIKHPNYNANTVNNDFALVRLSIPATATPVTMDMDGLSNTYTAGKKLWTIGFGNTLTSGENFPSRMKHVELSYVSTNTCSSAYGGGITANMMCAADPNEDSCQGDSGGPLYDKANGVLVGVVSFGNDCADPNYPGVYARISSKWTWIKTTICNDVNSAKPGFCGSSPVASPTSNSCTDTTDWYDSDGQGYDCEWYGDKTADVDRCAEYGSFFQNFGQTADEACCACGGGTPTAPSAPSPVTSSPVTSSPTRKPVTASPTRKPVASPVATPVASPVATPVASPVATPVASPVATPVSSPVATPTTSGLCQDTDQNFQYSPTQKKHCKFVGYNTIVRCLKQGVSENCPVTCETGCQCYDTSGGFFVSTNQRTCGWASSNPIVRCNNNVVRSNCPIVCGICNA